MIVRRARFEDLGQMLRCVEALWKEGKHGRLGFDHQATLISLQSAIQNPRKMALVVEEEGKIIGGMTGGLEQYFCVPKFFATEYGIWVAKERRGSRAAFLLVREFIKEAESMGALEVQTMVTSGLKEEKVRSFYKRLGFEFDGYSFRMTL